MNSTELETDYLSRINRVFQYIDDHISSDLSLTKISEIAFFSPFHFHRVFKYVTGETLNEYVIRRRIEKSALDLLHKKSTVIEIAHKFGFCDNSSYTRSFKKYYGISPTQFKKQNPHRFSKISQLESKIGQDYPDHEKYLCVIDNLKKWTKMNAKIEIIELPKMDVAYVSCLGPQNLDRAYSQLIKWATPLGLMNEHVKPITIYHDSFKVTEHDKVRMSAGLVLEHPVTTEGEIGLVSIEPGKFIKGSFEIKLNEFEKSWTGLFVWMNENGYKKADRDPFEIYHNNFKEHPEQKAIVDFYIPIKSQ